MSTHRVNIFADTQHDLFLHTFNYELHLAPLEGRIRNALDIGTGTGIWATQFGTSRLSIEIITKWHPSAAIPFRQCHRD